MRTKEIIEEIQRLPVVKRMQVIEKTLKSIRESEEQNKMNKAASALLKDYQTDKALTAFTDIDFEDFYEAR